MEANKGFLFEEGTVDLWVFLKVGKKGFLKEYRLTDIIILFALVVIPHRNGQALLGQIHNVRHEHKLSG